MSVDIINSFMSTTNIQETANGTVKKIMELLTKPESVEAMILMTDLEQPALSGVVKALEDNFAKSDFPLHHDGPGANAPNRRNIGWMIRYIMREFGYTPKKEEPLQMRVGKFSGSQYFKTAAVYEKTIDHPNYSIATQVVKN